MTLPSVLIKDTLLQAPANMIFGGTDDWAIYVGKMPVAPLRVVTIYDAPGRAPNPRWLLDYPSVQIKVRGNVGDYNIAGPKAVEIRNRLVGKPSYDAYDASGDRIVQINGMGDVSLLEWDDNDRPIFVFNLALITEPAATPGSHRDPL